MTLPECVAAASKERARADRAHRDHRPGQRARSARPTPASAARCPTSRTARARSWTPDRTRKESYATILAACWHRQRYGLLDIGIGLSATMTTFRWDLSTAVADHDGRGPQPGDDRAGRGTFYYDSCDTELRLSLEQARRVPMEMDKSGPAERRAHGRGGAASCSRPVGLPLPRSYNDRDVVDIARKALRARNPYLHELPGSTSEMTAVRRRLLPAGRWGPRRIGPATGGHGRAPPARLPLPAAGTDGGARRVRAPVVRHASRTRATTTSQIHCHSWDLVSHVLYGQVHNVHAEVTDAARDATHRVFEVVSAADGDRITPTARTVRQATGLVRGVRPRRHLHAARGVSTAAWCRRAARRPRSRSAGAVRAAATCHWARRRSATTTCPGSRCDAEETALAVRLIAAHLSLRDARMDLEHARAVAVDAARGGRRTARRPAPAAPRVRPKGGSGDVVTDLDLASEKLLLERVLTAFPEHAVIAEESGLLGAAGGEWTWLIDPLDGTNNVAIGLPAYVVGLALCRDGRPELGVVHDPVTGRPGRRSAAAAPSGREAL